MASFELREEERVARSPGEGGRTAAPVLPSPSRPHGVWFGLLVRGLGVVGLLVLLAGIGAVSSLYGGGGVAVAHGAATNEIGSAWLASEARGFHGAAGQERPDAGATPARPPGAGITPDGKVILNVATPDELRRLPGVGKRRAEAIVALRERLKRFRRVSDLLRVRGLGARGLKRIQPMVVLDPPAPTGDAGAR